MASDISVAASAAPYWFCRIEVRNQKPKSYQTRYMLPTLPNPAQKKFCFSRRKQRLKIAMTMKEKAENATQINHLSEKLENIKNGANDSPAEERLARKKSERRTYLIAAIFSSLGITSLSILAVYYRFSWQMEGGEFPLMEMFSIFSLSVGAAVGMEFWARWAHRALWHASLWDMHKSHHRPRDGPFEMNDIFAVANAVPAIALLSFGFFNQGLIPGLCFGAGLGITLFGIAYMFVHDGLVHRRFPLHHTDRFEGVPYGLFLGPKVKKHVYFEISFEEQKGMKMVGFAGIRGSGREGGAGEGDQKKKYSLQILISASETSDLP